MAADDYRQLSAFLSLDPDNAMLIADTARAALDAGELDEAARLVARHRAIAGEDRARTYLDGIVAMARQDWDAADAVFSRMIAQGDDAPPIRFNRAWSLAKAGRRSDALPLLDEAVVTTIPQGAQLLVGLLHERGDMAAAEAVARAAIERFPDHRGLNADVSTLAVDIEDLALARATAARAGSHPAALATLGILALDEDRPEAAAALFVDALARDPGNARAHIGSGLVALAGEDRTDAAAALDRGAASFATHSGSWIAAGWAHVLAGDRDAARDRFDRAMAIDDRFAEAHGSLAVLDLLAGDVERGRRRAAVAQRLDPECFSGALAAAMLATGAGDTAASERIVSLALNTPVDASGRTIGQALARMGGRG